MSDYPTPRQVVLTWIEAFNKADASALADLYTQDAVNHQVAEAPVVGKDAIRQMFAGGFASANMVCIRENLFEDASGRFWSGGIHWVCEAADFSRWSRG